MLSARETRIGSLAILKLEARHNRGYPTADPLKSAVGAAVPRRFSRLQSRYDRWGLAYLESLLRAADYAASSNPSAFVEDGQ